MYPFRSKHFNANRLNVTSTGLDSGKDTSVLAKRVKYYIPSLAWIPNYSFSLCVLICIMPLHMLTLDCLINRIGGDILAGLTVAAMLIPQSVSYATSLAKISPVTGLVRPAGPSALATSQPRLFTNECQFPITRYRPLSPALYMHFSELRDN